MSLEKPKSGDEKSSLSYFNINTHYEKKARLLPGLLCAMSLIPAGAAFGAPVTSWITLLAAGIGLWAVCGVGLSHVASAAGNRYQERLWPRWPYDAPTNRWLHPEDKTASIQQKKLMNEAIKRLTNLDIQAAVKQGPNEVEAVLNDCVTRLRHRLRNGPHADRLNIHNADYGFARNFAGLRSLWLTFLAISAASCWVGYVWFGCAFLWCVVSSGLLLIGILLAFGLNRYVRVRAKHYADSFFSAVLELDSVERKIHPPAKELTKPIKKSAKNKANNLEPKDGAEATKSSERQNKK